MTDQPQIFRSSISYGLLGVLVLVIGVGPFIALSGVPAAQRFEVAYKFALILALPVALIAWMYRTTSYRIEGTTLQVRSGPMLWKIDLSTVRSLRATNSLMSAPALSLDRIEIGFGHYDSVVISPANKQGFVKAVLAHAPTVSLEGLDEFR